MDPRLLRAGDDSEHILDGAGDAGLKMGLEFGDIDEKVGLPNGLRYGQGLYESGRKGKADGLPGQIDEGPLGGIQNSRNLGAKMIGGIAVHSRIVADRAGGSPFSQ
jgi:hypothetical protein